MRIIQEALKMQGIDAAWQGEDPTDGSAITNTYLNEVLSSGLPRMIRSDADTGSIVNLVQLRLDFNNLKVTKEEEYRVGAIKKAAGELIINHLPDWKQRNLTARSVELINLSKDRNYTVQEQAEVDVINTIWAWVKQVRASSDAAEKEGKYAHQVIWPAFPQL